MQDYSSRYASYWDYADAEPKKKKKKAYDAFDYSEVAYGNAITSAYTDDAYYGTASTYAYEPIPMRSIWAESTNSYWSNFSTKFASYEDTFAKKEKRRKIEKKLKSFALSQWVNVNLNLWTLKNSVTKKAYASLSISDEIVNKISQSFSKNWEPLINGIKRLPQNASLKEKLLFEHVFFDSDQIKYFRNIHPSFSLTHLLLTADKYFKEWIGSLEDITKYLEETSDTAKMEQKEKAKGTWGWEFEGNLVPSLLSCYSPTLWEKFAKIIKSKFYFPDKILREPHKCKGSRINRQYLYWISDKPVVWKHSEKSKKKRILIVIDGSGSMDTCWADEFKNIRNSAISSSFAYWIINSDVFDVTATVIHSTQWWCNINNELKSWKVRYCNTGAEWFEKIDKTIPKDWARDSEYVLFLTDMDISDTARECMRDYLKSSGKHMILSFYKWGDLAWLNVKVVTDMKWMIDGVARLLA